MTDKNKHDTYAHIAAGGFSIEADGCPACERYSLQAAPAAIDTGTLYIDTSYCTHCLQPIERDQPLYPVTWFHSDTKSTYCYHRGEL